MLGKILVIFVQNEWHWAATMLERVLFVIFVILGAATALLFAGR